MATALITHHACLDHAFGDQHPERPDRLRHVLRALEHEQFQDLVRVDAPLASRADLARAHDDVMIDQLEKSAALSDGEIASIDGDTYMTRHTREAALRGAGAVIEAVDMVMSGEVGNAFCATRPPGHHAERRRAMGFCLINPVAIGALYALDQKGLDRVAIVDFDVHHGNGTQDIFERDGRVMYASTHEWPLYPGTGDEHEVGVGNIVNVHLSALAGSVEFREALAAGVFPALERFEPQLIFISAGFDAHGDDPLAQLLVNERDFAWATTQLCKLAAKHCRGRVVSTLEGGYDLGSLSRSVVAHVAALKDHGMVTSL